MTIYISQEFNSVDALQIGICKADFSLFIKRSTEYREDLENGGIVTCTFETFIKLFDKIKVEYHTDDAFYNGNVLYINNCHEFSELCGEPKSNNLHNTWLGVLRNIAIDIDTVEERYGDLDTGKFLRSMLAYFSVFAVVTELRD